MFMKYSKYFIFKTNLYEKTTLTNIFRLSHRLHVLPIDIKAFMRCPLYKWVHYKQAMCAFYPTHY